MTPTLTSERSVTEAQENPLKTLLEETGMSQRELGRILGIEAGAVWRKVNGKVGLTKEASAFYKLLLKLHRDGEPVKEILSNLP